MIHIDRRTWILMAVMLVAVFLLTFFLGWDISVQGTTYGYWTLGDVGVYASAALLGGPLGAIVSALGSMIADFARGRAEYALAAFFIKGGMALLCAWYLKRGSTLMHFIKTVCYGGVLMTAGYFVYDLVFRADFLRAAIMLPFHILQILACGILGVGVLFLLSGKSYQNKDTGFSMRKGSAVHSKRMLK